MLKAKYVVAKSIFPSIRPRERQALSVRDQGRILQPDRRLLHGLAMKSRLATAALNHAVTRAVRSPAAFCTPIVVLNCSSNFVHAWAATTWIGSMAASALPGQCEPWRASLVCCRRTCWTVADWNAREGLRIAIVAWIERTYRRRRRQAALGRLTQIEFEAIMTTPASQAA